MEGESVLDTLFDEESVEDAQDVEMLDIEEGELTEQISKAEIGENSDVGVKQVNQESNQRSSRRKKKKKKNQKRSSSSGPNVTNINRFVLDVCKRLRERKSYLVWTAVGCLGVSALSDLVKEVDAIQACGGQRTADGRRSRNGGGILWNIIKLRDPNAYKEIMKKGKEFEKQFKQQVNGKLGQLMPQTDVDLNGKKIKCDMSDGLELASPNESEKMGAGKQQGVSVVSHEEIGGGQKRASVCDRIRVPVAYDDLLGGEDIEPAVA